MRRATDSLSTPLPPDSHTPTPKGGGSGRERVRDSHGTPTGEWESLRLSIKSELDQIRHANNEATKAKLAAKKQHRQEKKRKRDAGLRLRHAGKMRRINP